MTKHVKERVPGADVRAALDRPAVWEMDAVIDLNGCDLDRLRAPDIWRGFIANLVAVTDMTAHGDLRMEQSGQGGPCGWSAVQLTETGSITGRGDEPGLRCSWNVIDCREFDPIAAATVAAAYFGGDLTLKVLRRRASPPAAEAAR